jgi:hypothetical protein
LKGVRLVAVCDADKTHTAKHAAAMEKDNQKLEQYQDIRKLLESKEIDAVVTATPNHWHSLATVWACQAGKDMYVEKPASHNIWEGRKCVEAARKYNRMVQHGTQQRSCSAPKEAFEWLQKGNLGKILYVRGFCYKPRNSIGKVTAPTPIPPEVDYDLWCGPAPKDPLTRKKLHYDWHWVWPTGNGDIGNQGVHEMDLCRRALGQQTLPTRVVGFGGRFLVDDDATTPNTLVGFYDYKPIPMIFEVRGLPAGPIPKDGKWGPMDRYKGVGVGVVVMCEGGYYSHGSGGGWVYDKDGKKTDKKFVGDGGGGHLANYIKAVRSRKVEDLNADILEGHFSAALCHMPNISYRLGKTVKPEDVAEMAKCDKEATDSWGRMKEHLAKHDVDLAKSLTTLGPWLTFDPEKEQFTGELASEANKLVTREYRAPFVVPEKV